MEAKKNSGNENVVWGAIFIIGALALLANKLGFLNLLLGGMDFFDIVATVALVYLLVKGMAKHSFGQILFSVAFIIIVNDKILHMEAFTPWTVLAAAGLGTIGLNLMFAKKGHGRFLTINGKEMTVPRQAGAEIRQGTRVSYDNCFGEAIKYVSGEVSRVTLDNCFGSIQVYFTDAQLTDGTAEVISNTCFGSIILYVPAEWKVIVKADNAFGGTSETGQCNAEGTVVLYVRSSVAFGKLQIRYI